jgi:hypothetical protein
MSEQPPLSLIVQIQAQAAVVGGHQLAFTKSCFKSEKDIYRCRSNKRFS